MRVPSNANVRSFHCSLYNVLFLQLTEGTDFDTLVSTLTFNASVSSVCVQLTARGDSVYEFDEQLSLSLTTSDNQVDITTSSVQVNITDATDGQWGMLS